MKVAIRTDIGLKRSKNEDFVSRFVNQDQDLLVIVADGIGGSKSGEVASRLVVNKLGLAFSVTTFSSMDLEEIKHWFVTELTQINNYIVEQSKCNKELESMGTTIVFAYFSEFTSLIGHVGDSRAYVQQERLSCLTDDHTFANALYKLSKITKEEAENHPDRHKLIKAIGLPLKGDIEVDFNNNILYDNDIYLLCTDGLTNMVSDDEIEKVLKTEQTLDLKANILLEKAKEAGGYDNISLALIDNKKEVND